MSEFKKINEAEVTFSGPDGFRLKYGKDVLTFKKGKRYVLVPIEHLGYPYEMVVYLNKADSWMEKGRCVMKISQEEMDSIEQDIFTSLSFLGGGNFTIKR